MITVQRILSSASAILLFALCSCQEDGVDGQVSMTCTDIVTFAGNDNGNALFTFQKVDDSPLITLRSQISINTDEYPAGTRMLISYNPPENRAYTSGDVRLIGARTITQSAIYTEWSPDFDAWDRDPVYVYSTWRTGNYLNVHVRLTYSTEPRLFCLAADPATLDTPWPDVYMVHTMASETDNHDRAYYASFDLSPVWDQPGVEGIRLHVANSNLDKHIFTFARQH